MPASLTLVKKNSSGAVNTILSGAEGGMGMTPIRVKIMSIGP